VLRRAPRVAGRGTRSTGSWRIVNGNQLHSWTDGHVWARGFADALERPSGTRVRRAGSHRRHRGLPSAGSQGRQSWPGWPSIRGSPLATCTGKGITSVTAADIASSDVELGACCVKCWRSCGAPRGGVSVAPTGDDPRSHPLDGVASLQRRLSRPNRGRLSFYGAASASAHGPPRAVSGKWSGGPGNLIAGTAARTVHLMTKLRTLPMGEARTRYPVAWMSRTSPASWPPWPRLRRQGSVHQGGRQEGRGGRAAGDRDPRRPGCRALAAASPN